MIHETEGIIRTMKRRRDWFVTRPVISRRIWLDNGTGKKWCTKSSLCMARYTQTCITPSCGLDLAFRGDLQCQHAHYDRLGVGWDPSQAPHLVWVAIEDGLDVGLVVAFHCVGSDTESGPDRTRVELGAVRNVTPFPLEEYSAPEDLGF
jgi:hypothetical protein